MKFKPQIPLAVALTGLLAACSANGRLPVETITSGTSGTGTTTTSNTVVTTANTTPALPSLTIAASPQVVQEGQSSLLTWTAANATACTAGGAWSGSQPVTNSTGWSTGALDQPGTYTYGLTCTGSGGSVSSQGLVFVGTVSAPGVTLTVAPTAIQPGDSATLTWSSTNGTSCSASGGTGSDNWNGNQPAQNVVGFNTGKISTAGEYSYTLTCTGPGGTGTASQILTVAASAPPAPPAITFNAQPTLLTPGGSTTLTWNVANATSCAASGGTGSDGWSGTEPLTSSGTTMGPIATVGTYTYTLTCTGAGGVNSQNASIVVSSNPTPPAVTVSVNVSPATIIAGQSALLSWSTTNATSCIASGSWGGTQATTGSAFSTGTLSVAAVYSYTLTCTGPGGSGSATATLTANPAIATITNFAANPINLQVGQSTSLSWATDGATGCTASGGSGSDSWSGSRATSSSGTSIGPLNTAGIYTYTLTCTGPGGPSIPSSVIVTVSAGSTPPPPVIVAFAAVPATIQAGQSTTLTWATVNTTSCTATGGSGADSWSGAEPTASIATLIGPLNTAGTYTYTLTCSGAGGTSSPSSVTVTVGAAPALPVISALIATPATVSVGQSTTLTWATVGASSCTASGGTGSDGWSGSNEPVLGIGTLVGPFTAAGSYTYTLTCSGPGGTGVPNSVTVTVNPPPPGAPVVTFTVNGSNNTSIRPGQSATLAWSATNATACTAIGGAIGSGWSGTLAISNSGMSIGPINVTGVYTYTLSCTGPGGTTGASVAVTVLPASSVSCGLPSQTVQLLSPAATATSGVRGLCLLGCGTSNLSNVTNSNLTDYATMNVAVGVAASAYIRVTDGTMTYPAGRQAGFLVADPSALLTLALLQNVSVSTLLNGTLQETATTGNLLTLQALGLLGNPHEGYVGFTTTKPFNSVEIDLGQLASVLGSLDVFGSCVSLQ